MMKIKLKQTKEESLKKRLYEISHTFNVKFVQRPGRIGNEPVSESFVLGKMYTCVHAVFLSFFLSFGSNRINVD